MIQALAIPTGIAINSGFGLLTPFGGAKDIKRHCHQKKIHLKLQMFLGEVALKYIMGRTGTTYCLIVSLVKYALM